jgi:hypothetical protein
MPSLTINSSTSVTVSWVNNEPNPYNLYLDRADDSGFTTNVASEVLSMGTTSFTDTTLIPGNNYYWRVRTVNASGTSNSATVALTVTMSPTGISSSQAIGSPFVATKLSPTGIASSQAFGAPVVSAVLRPTGIPSLQSIGHPTLNALIFPHGIASLQALGSPTLSAIISPTGIASAGSFGRAKVSLPPPTTGGNSAPLIVIKLGVTSDFPVTILE